MNLWLANLARAWRYLLLHGHWCRHPGYGLLVALQPGRR